MWWLLRFLKESLTLEKLQLLSKNQLIKEDFGKVRQSVDVRRESFWWGSLWCVCFLVTVCRADAAPGQTQLSWLSSCREIPMLITVWRPPSLFLFTFWTIRAYSPSETKTERLNFDFSMEPRLTSHRSAHTRWSFASVVDDFAVGYVFAVFLCIGRPTILLN